MDTYKNFTRSLEAFFQQYLIKRNVVQASKR